MTPMQVNVNDIPDRSRNLRPHLRPHETATRKLLEVDPSLDKDEYHQLILLAIIADELFALRNTLEKL